MREVSPLSLASSTSTISSSRCLGDLSITLWTVRSRVVQASLWNTITTLVRGRSSGYTFVLHLENTQSQEEWISCKIKTRHDNHQYTRNYSEPKLILKNLASETRTHCTGSQELQKALSELRLALITNTQPVMENW